MMGDPSFAFIVTLAGIICWVFALLWTKWASDNSPGTTPQRARWQGVIIFFFLASVSLMAFGITLKPLKHDIDLPDEAGPVGMVGAGIVFVVFFALILVYDSCCRAEPHLIPSIPGLWGLAVTACFLIPGLILLAIYRRETTTLEEYEFFGSMRILGSDARRHPKVDDRLVEYSRYHGVIEAGWGREWGCPSSPDRWCEDFVYDEECTFCDPDRTNDGNCQAGGLDDAEFCIDEKYDLLEMADSDGTDEPDFDKDLPPENDPTWPYHSFYGDCSSCQAKRAEDFESHQYYVVRLKPVGIGLTSAGLVIDALIILWQARRKAFVPTAVAQET
jgi:hypothetical protein